MKTAKEQCYILAAAMVILVIIVACVLPALSSLMRAFDAMIR